MLPLEHFKVNAQFPQKYSIGKALTTVLNVFIILFVFKENFKKQIVFFFLYKNALIDLSIGFSCYKVVVHVESEASRSCSMSVWGTFGLLCCTSKHTHDCCYSSSLFGLRLNHGGWGDWLGEEILTTTDTLTSFRHCTHTLPPLVLACLSFWCLVLYLTDIHCSSRSSRQWFQSDSQAGRAGSLVLLESPRSHFTHMFLVHLMTM